MNHGNMKVEVLPYLTYDRLSTTHNHKQWLHVEHLGVLALQSDNWDLPLLFLLSIEFWGKLLNFAISWFSHIYTRGKG